MKVKLFLATLVTGIFTLTSCSKDSNKEEEKKPANVKQEKNLNARQEKWVYYSFEKNAIVEVADPQNSLDWDIAFFAYYAKLNGGASGKGQAGVAKTENKDFSAPIATLPSEYIQDVKGTMSYGNYPNLTEKEDTFSTFLSGGFDTPTGYVSLNPNNRQSSGGKWPSVYAPTKWVYVLKTAKGAFVKFQVTDFYNDKTDANYPSFQYILSEDGKF
ncbi:HmuY family protein [Capnocytophaga gingivalis]|uniref:HmuY family protein n=1 Tax=Capnocytophaga gingivalis TaxID=1017 RepID=UPI0023EF5F3C|nr:HmuY family protein [Capnocytophaga gingivalis]